MNGDGAKIVCEGAAAIAAIVAAISWRAAARKPVAKYAGTGYGGLFGARVFGAVTSIDDV